jgi:hypothetical protein
MPPLDQDRGDFPSVADELARRREIHERKSKSGLRKRQEIYLGYPDFSFPRFTLFRSGAALARAKLVLLNRVRRIRNANHNRFHRARRYTIRESLPSGGRL